MRRALLPTKKQALSLVGAPVRQWTPDHPLFSLAQGPLLSLLRGGLIDTEVDGAGYRPPPWFLQPVKLCPFVPTAVSGHCQPQPPHLSGFNQGPSNASGPQKINKIPFPLDLKISCSKGKREMGKRKPLPGRARPGIWGVLRCPPGSHLPYQERLCWPRHGVLLSIWS